jgi:hypothetical protein
VGQTLGFFAIVAANLAASCSNRPTAAIRCFHFPEREPAVCTQATDGSAVLSRPSLARVDFGTEGLGAIIVDDRICFVNRQGKTAPALIFDNGPDYVVEGLARTVRNGKVGFVNTSLDVVVAPVWDFASPFRDGFAEVCMGCVKTPASPGDEHKMMTGGKWGYIDKSGKVKVPLVYDSPSAAAAHLPAR